MLRSAVRAAGLLALVVVGTLAFVALLNVTVYLEASVPDRDDLPELPAGLSVTEVSEGCGSGNCYLEFVVEGESGATPESIFGELPAEECTANTLIDRRPRCVGYEIRAGRVIGAISIGKWLG